MNKSLKKNFNKKLLKNFLINLIFIFLTEIVFKLILHYSVFSLSVIRIIFFGAIVSLILSFIYMFIKDKAVKIINGIIMFIYTFYAFFQIGAVNYIGAYMSVNASGQLDKVTEYIKEFFSGYIFSYYLIFIPFVLLIVFYIFEKKILKTKEQKLKKNKEYYLVNSLISLISLIVFGVLFYASMTLGFLQNKLQVMSNKDLFHYPSNQSITVNQFGILGYCVIDIKSFILKTEAKVEYTNSNNEQNNEKENKREIDDSLWNALIELESDEENNSLNSYLINQTITSKNEYTGLFKGKNVVVVLMESVNDIIRMYPEYYPAFNKMYNEGISFRNNYSPRNSCSTGNNELTVLTSLYTINNTCTYNRYKKNTYPESIFNMFKNNGYATTSYHNYLDYYYDREVTHPNLGVDKFYNIYDLNMKFTNLYDEVPSDYEMMVNAVPEFINEDKFMAYIMTVTPHRPYVSMEMSDKYLDLFKDLDLPLATKRYLSKVKELDNALQYLLDSLEKSGKLDDTVIVLAGDHYPYGLSDSTISKILDYEIEETYEKDRTPFVIYNSELESPVVIEEYSTIVDILPTLLNLMGFEFDPRLYFGEDILSEEYSGLAVFSDGSWKNEFAFYDASKSKIVYYTDQKYSDIEIQQINTMVTNKISMSNAAIRNNYFEYLFSNLEKLKLEEESTPIEAE